MLVVNQGLSGVYHIFRGGEAQEFLAGLDVATADRCVVILPKTRLERARFLMTKAGTFVLALNAEDITDPMARLAFQQILKKLHKQQRRAHGSA